MALKDFFRKAVIARKLPCLEVFLGLSLLVMVMVILIVLTPLPNWLARPLRVESRIEKADVILVLSGGSYPSGALSGFSLERTVWAVELYRRGLAPKIIFSGRSFSGNDAEAMKSLAVSLGVSSDDILLEDTSRSTYENFLFSAKIIKEKNFAKILVITSPIHLYRSLIIAEKVSSKIRFSPASFPSYDDFRRDPLDRLILFWFTGREYLGIIREYFR